MEQPSIGAQVASLITADNIQKYIFGSKKSGQPRALYDIVKDFKLKNKKKKNKIPLLSLNFKKKKKKKHKKDDWKF